MLRHILWKGNTFRNCGVPDPLLVGDPSPHIPQWGFPQSYSYQKWISKCRLGWIRGVCKSNGKIMQLFWNLIHCFRVSIFCYFWSSLSMFLFIFFLSAAFLFMLFETLTQMTDKASSSTFDSSVTWYLLFSISGSDFFFF